jgi:hypothetical protein
MSGHIQLKWTKPVSPLARWKNARVAPHAGQGMPVASRSGQV